MAVRPIDASHLFDRVYQAYGDMIDENSANLFMRWINEEPTLTQPNEPLTPDELKEWNRNPAWIVPLGEQPWDAQWSIMEYGRFVVETNMGPTKSVCLNLGGSGKTWFAYRHPVAGNCLNIDGNKCLHNSGESEESFHEFK